MPVYDPALTIYHDVVNGWVFFDGLTQRFFGTEQEARNAMAKLDTAKAIVQAVQSLAPATDSAGDLEAEYFDIGSWVDADVEALGITAADLAACLTLLQQVDKLMTNQATSAAMYRATLNKVRRAAVS